jgi:hypothetical protein
MFTRNYFDALLQGALSTQEVVICLGKKELKVKIRRRGGSFSKKELCSAQQRERWLRGPVVESDPLPHNETIYL